MNNIAQTNLNQYFKLNTVEERDMMPLDELILEALDVYRSIPGNVKINCSFSGGKDSTVMSILLCIAIEKGLINPDNVEFIYSNTKLEMPNLHGYAVNFLNFINKKYGVNTTIVEPNLEDTYWVKLLGRGDFASNHHARWCVKPLKIDPITTYFNSTLDEDEEYLVIVGIRLDESANREEKYKDVDQVPSYSCDTQGECFAPLEDEPRAFPLLNWKNCHIWDFLQFHEWSYKFPVKNLREIYLNNDTLRYGCWMCTVAGRNSHVVDVALDNDYNGLGEFRKYLIDNFTNGKKSKRPQDWIYTLRGKGKHEGKYVPSKLTVTARQQLLLKLLRLQKSIRDKGHEFTAITTDEVRLIRDMWNDYPDEQNSDWKYYHELQHSLEDTL